MTAKTKKSAAGTAVVKQTVISGGVGMISSLIISLITSWIAVKTGDPLSIAGTMAAICVLCGAATAAITGGVMGKSFSGGLYAGGLYTVVCVLISLCMPSTDGSPLIQVGAAVFGTLGGCALTRSHKPSTKKRLKKYVKR